MIVSLVLQHLLAQYQFFIPEADLFPLVDVVAVILQLLLENVRNINADRDRLLFTLPFGVSFLLLPL